MKRQNNLFKKTGRNIKRSRARGIQYEQQIANELRQLGFTGVKTSRAESKTMDDNKIDFIDIDNKLPCYIQAKKTQKCPNYFAIEHECPLKDKPFVIFWNAQKTTDKTFRSIGEVAIIPKEFFYKLLRNYE